MSAPESRANGPREVFVEGGDGQPSDRHKMILVSVCCGSIAQKRELSLPGTPGGPGHLSFDKWRTDGNALRELPISLLPSIA